MYRRQALLLTFVFYLMLPLGSFYHFYRLHMMCLSTRVVFFWLKHYSHTYLLKLRSHFLCGRMLSKCSYNGQLDWALMFTARKGSPNQWKIHIPENTLAFPGALWCIYNHLFTASQQSERHVQIKLEHVTFSELGTVQYQWAYRNLPGAGWSAGNTLDMK